MTMFHVVIDQLICDKVKEAFWHLPFLLDYCKFRSTSCDSLSTMGIRKDTVVFTPWPFIQKDWGSFEWKGYKHKHGNTNVIPMQLILSYMMETSLISLRSFSFDLEKVIQDTCLRCWKYHYSSLHLYLKIAELSKHLLTSVSCSEAYFYIM